jgi:hypothetical protein
MRSRRNSHAFKEEPDREVYEPAPIVPIRSRVSTDELTMQIHSPIDGCYHRRIPTLSHTACEQPIHSQLGDLRREELFHPLCRRGCFSAFELRLADERQEKENDNG